MDPMSIHEKNSEENTYKRILFELEKDISDKYTAQIVVNEEKLKPFSLIQGTRQEYPPSLFR